MAEFLTAGWIAELDAAAAASPEIAALGARGPLTLEQRVRVLDGGEIVYHFAVDEDAAHVRSGPAHDPDIVVLTDRATAEAMHRGELNVQRGLTEGRLKLRGDLTRLVARSELLVALDDAFATVRRTTTFPSTSAES